MQPSDRVSGHMCNPDAKKQGNVRAGFCARTMNTNQTTDKIHQETIVGLSTASLLRFYNSDKNLCCAHKLRRSERDVYVQLLITETRWIYLQLVFFFQIICMYLRSIMPVCGPFIIKVVTLETWVHPHNQVSGPYVWHHIDNPNALKQGNDKSNYG